jgi:ligand-binding sensor domain-containing protein
MKRKKNLGGMIALLLSLFLGHSCTKDDDALKPEEVEKWTYLTTSNGLPSNQINCMAEDNSGNIWIGTDKGLAKYDGSSFTLYSRKTGLPSDSIYSLFLSRTSEMYVGTQNGFGRFTSSGAYATIYKYRNWQFVDFCEDKKADYVYCATVLGVVTYNYTDRDLSLIPIDSTLIGGEYYNDQVFDVETDDNNYTWISAEKGIYVYAMKKEFYSNQSLGIPYLSLWSGLYCDKTGKMWITPSQDQKIICYTANKFVNDSVFLGLNQYKSIVQDKYSNYWVSMYKRGVLNFSGGMAKLYNTTNSAIGSNKINVILCDKKENLWFGSSDIGLIHLQNIKPLQLSSDGNIPSFGANIQNE